MTKIKKIVKTISNTAKKKYSNPDLKTINMSGSIKPVNLKIPKFKKFVPTYAGKVGGQMSDGTGWGGEMPVKKVAPKKRTTSTGYMVR